MSEIFAFFLAMFSHPVIIAGCEGYGIPCYMTGCVQLEYLLHVRNEVILNGASLPTASSSLSSSAQTEVDRPAFSSSGFLNAYWRLQYIAPSVS